MSFNTLPDTFPAQPSRAPYSHSRSRSDFVSMTSSSSRYNIENQREYESVQPVQPVLNAPRPIRPLPKPPTLVIDTQNILPSHISTPQQPPKELTPLDVPSPRREGGGPGPSSSPLTATYKSTAIPLTTPRGTSGSPQYTLPIVPPLFSTPLSDLKIPANGGNFAEGTAISDRTGAGGSSQSAQVSHRRKVSSPGSMSDLESWRRTILIELEETYSVSLPVDRTPSLSSRTKLAQLYPVRITT